MTARRAGLGQAVWVVDLNSTVAWTWVVPNMAVRAAGGDVRRRGAAMITVKYGGLLEALSSPRPGVQFFATGSAIR